VTDQEDALLERIEALLGDQRLAGDPLREPLEELFHRYRSQGRLLDRIVHIADGFQLAERERGDKYHKDYQRKVRQLEKIVRISDRYQQMMRELNERLHTLSTRDELTGLPNRRYLLERLQAEVSYAARNDATFCLALLDLDHFKAVNDTLGHAAGDSVLISIAQTLQASIRDYDVCGRWGGEEFLILLPRTLGAAAFDLAERLRRAVAAPVDTPQGPVRLTASIGVTEFRAGESLDEALMRVDRALYDAKAERDRSVLL